MNTSLQQDTLDLDRDLSKDFGKIFFNRNGTSLFDCYDLMGRKIGTVISSENHAMDDALQVYECTARVEYVRPAYPIFSAKEKKLIQACSSKNKRHINSWEGK